MKKLFTAAQFTATKWDTAKDKADFANKFVQFVEDGYPQASFQKKFYNRLNHCFGHIAHFDVHGFYNVFFTSTIGKVHFLRQAAEWATSGDPVFTYSDVEVVLRASIIREKVLDKAVAADKEACEQNERAMLRALKAKYEGGTP